MSYLVIPSQQLLYRFSLKFFLVNACLSLIVGLNYISVLPNFQVMADSSFSEMFLWLFLIISFVAQIALLFLACHLLVCLITRLIPKKSIIFPLAITLGAAIIFCLIGDSIAFKLYHMHYAAVGIEIIKVNALSQVISFSVGEVFKLIMAGIILFLLESLMAWRIWLHTKKARTGRGPYMIAAVFCLAIGVSYGLNFMARNGASSLSENTRYLMVKATRFLPYYDELYQLLLPFSNQTQDIRTANGTIHFTPYNSSQPLNYPKQPLRCAKATSPLNIVVIAIDTWRFDAMNSKVTPNISRFAQKTLQFKNHWSGGNCTQSGLFSFFYGLPANYWDAFLQQQRGPELIHQLIKANYKMAIFTSAAPTFPAFDRTIFQEIKAQLTRTPGDTTIARDQMVTQNFKKFLAQRNSQQPFFSFVFYDAVHNYCENATPARHPFKPWLKVCNRLSLKKNTNPRRYVGRYLNAVYFVDNEIKQIITALEQQNLLKNTIVVITSDHGEEINDGFSGYWQHASAYTPYQLHTPFMVYWPGQKPHVYNHFTTHYDFVPTMMKQVLHCQNSGSDYAIGESLFSAAARPVLISGSYADYAVISKNQIARIYPGGDYGADDARGKPIAKQSLHLQPLQQAFYYLHSYFK